MKFRRRFTINSVILYIKRMFCLSSLKNYWEEFTYFTINHGLLAFVLCACYFETLRWLWISLCFINVLLLIRSLEDKLVFYNEEPPDSRTWVDPPALYGVPPSGFEEFYLTTSDGVKVHSYFLKYRNGQEKPEWTILFLHGNAGNIGHRLVHAVQLSESCRANVMLLDYRGYGLSEGRPSEIGFYRDAETALAFLANVYPVRIQHLHRRATSASSANKSDLQTASSDHIDVAVDVEADNDRLIHQKRRDPVSRSAYLAELQIDSQRIAVYGQSIGGAVSVYLASDDCSLRSHVAALLLENTFTSLPEIGKLLFRSTVPLVVRIPNCLVKNQFGSIRRITTIRMPTMFISGSSDQLVPPAMMYALHERARESRLRRLVKFARGTHNDTWLAHGYYPAVANFLSDAARYTAATS